MERLTTCHGNVAVIKNKNFGEAAAKLALYEDTGLSPNDCMNYKIFEDECIYDGVTFKDVLRLKDILKGMTCETCRDHGKCAIEDNFNIKYCSDWRKKYGKIY